MMQEIKKVRKDKEAYVQDVPEATHHDSTSADSVKSVIKISECCRTPIECSHSIQIAQWTKKCNVDLVTSLAEHSSA